MFKTSRLLLAVVALLMLFAKNVDALCLAQQTSAVLLTPLDAAIPADGSLLVAIQYGPGQHGVQANYGERGEFTVPPLALVQGTRRVAVTQHPLPGGLIQLRFERHPPIGTYALEGFARPGSAPPAITIGGTLPPPPVAPRLTSVTHSVRHETYEGPRGSGRRTHWETHVTLAQELPMGLAFVVLRAVGSTQDLQFFQALSGTELEDSGMLGGRCAPGLVEGRGMVTERAQVEAVVIDSFGRVSPPSAPVRVR